MVTARAIIILLAEKGDIHEICTQYPPGGAPVSPRLMAPKIPNILVLTTPSTAMTRAGTAVMDTETRHRLELFDPKTRPAAMIWDDDALLTAPTDLWLSTAASAFSGILTGVAAPRSNPISHGDNLHALRLSLESLPPAPNGARQHDGTHESRRGVVPFEPRTGCDAGRAFGIVSSLGHVIDTLYAHISHGDSHSLTTAWGMRFNQARASAGLARLAHALGVGTGVPEGDAGEARHRFRRRFLPEAWHAGAAQRREYSAGRHRADRTRCNGRLLSASERAQGEASVGAGRTSSGRCGDPSDARRRQSQIH